MKGNCRREFKKVFKNQWEQLKQNHATRAVKLQFLDLKAGIGPQWSAILSMSYISS